MAKIKKSYSPHDRLDINQQDLFRFVVGTATLKHLDYLKLIIHVLKTKVIILGIYPKETLRNG